MAFKPRLSFAYEVRAEGKESSSYQLYENIARDAGLRGRLGISINKTLVAGWSAGMQSHCGKTRLCMEESEFPDHLKGGRGMISILSTFEMLNMLLIIHSAIFDKNQ